MSLHAFGTPRWSLTALAEDCVPGIVSVIIPCYNAAPFVAQAIESALAQTYDRIEVLVVDDGSTDSSLHEVKRYEDKVTVLTGANRGACAARNTGLEHARGEFIQFLDADDLLEPGAVAARLGAFTPDVDMVFGDMTYATGDGTPIARYASPHSQRRWQSMGMLDYIFVVNIHTMEALHRRSALYSVGGWDESIPQGQEPDLHLRLYLAGHRFLYRQCMVGRFRQHASPARVGSSGWWTRDPERYISLAVHWAGLVGASRFSEGSWSFRRTMAAMLCGHAVTLCAAGESGLARHHYDALLQLCPDFRPHGAAGLVSRVAGLWTTIRLGGLRARLAEKVSRHRGWERR